MCAHRSRSYGLGKPCSSRLRTLLMAATVGCDSEVSLSVRSSLGISWNSRSSLAFLAASLFDTGCHTHRCKFSYLFMQHHHHYYYYGPFIQMWAQGISLLTLAWILSEVQWNARTETDGVHMEHGARPEEQKETETSAEVVFGNNLL